MSFILFISASMLEYISFFIFVMVLFRFTIREHILKFILGAVILAFVSNTVQTESLQDISPLINVVILFFLVTIILKTKLFHSLVMVVISYIAYSLVQWVLYSTFIYFDVVQEFVPYTWSGYFLQFLSVSVMCLFSCFIYFTKGGFSYIQSTSRFDKDSIRTNKWFAIFMILGIAILSTANILYLTSDRVPDSLASISVAIVVILIVLLYFSVRKDR